MSPRLPLTVALCLVAPHLARADEPAAPTTDAEPADEPRGVGPPPRQDEPGRTYESATYSAATVGDVRTNLSDWAVGPPGWDLGGELRLITSDQGFGSEPRLKLTDVGLVRARLRATASRRIEAFAAMDLLAKQPGYLDEPVVQGGTVGLKVAVSRKWALSTGVSGGPALADAGFWGSGGTTMIYRAHPDETLSFQGSLGAGATALSLDGTGENPWLAEASVGGTIMIHSPNGWFGTWLGAGLSVPVVHGDAIDPGNRLDLTIGMAYAVVKEWDIYFEAGIFDRGDKGHPETQLPILDGGFDQRTLIIGVTRRFEGKEARHRRSGDALLQLGS